VLWVREVKDAYLHAWGWCQVDGIIGSGRAWSQQHCRLREDGSVVGIGTTQGR
jgi:hypothetical protein